ncbi:hypothetical protein QJS04_geneDACA021677 [Acorus gramineus]|uniref:Fungal lipase-type domain-containing protein n=1 Tax=Acorus gramineus TaxID=55184 RepID=A0AAV9A2A5_ACOGR|nr:hypothetical protein QJS04_geneDACA021677 [Acorus gramineus]
MADIVSSAFPHTRIINCSYHVRALGNHLDIRACDRRISTVRSGDNRTNCNRGTIGIRLPEKHSVSNLLLHVFHDQRKQAPLERALFRSATPAKSPKEVISWMWRDIHGSDNWDGLLDPLHPWLRREIVKYGELAQATYDAFDPHRPESSCYSPRGLLDRLGLAENGYRVSEYVYATSHVELPRWLERSLHADAWTAGESHWMGYVAVSDDVETRRIGRRDIVVAWRGTAAASEWFKDLQARLEPVEGRRRGEHARVEHGFQSVYRSRSASAVRNKNTDLSASEQVMAQVTALVNSYRAKGEEVSLTVTGHSLGGALALLNAHEAALTIPELPVSVISFGAPRVGNAAFGDELRELGVRVLRVVAEQDLVPKMPGVLVNESVDKNCRAHEGVYAHVGTELRVDTHVSPYLKRGFDPAGVHGLETYMHLVDGYMCRRSGFRAEAKRDVLLVNKACAMLKEELRAPSCWYHRPSPRIRQEWPSSPYQPSPVAC